jgi:hypothetical protein
MDREHNTGEDLSDDTRFHELSGNIAEATPGSQNCNDGECKMTKLNG